MLLANYTCTLLPITLGLKIQNLMNHNQASPKEMKKRRWINHLRFDNAVHQHSICKVSTLQILLAHSYHHQP